MWALVAKLLLSSALILEYLYTSILYAGVQQLQIAQYLLLAVSHKSPNALLHENICMHTM